MDAQELARRLRAAGCVFAEDEAAVLLSTTSDAGELGRLVQRRSEGIPLEHVVGWAEFCGERVTVRAGVFVPRRRSEFLARCASSLASDGATIVDLCCGTGALGLVAARGRSGVDLHAVDCDAAAVACAASNLPQATLHIGDLFAPLPATLRGTVDLVLAVTPYVPTAELHYLHREARLHEPASAHDGGPDGLLLTGRILAEAGDWLAPRGVVLAEISEAQGPAALELARAHGLQASVERDEASDATVVVARLTSAPWSQLSLR